MSSSGSGSGSGGYSGSPIAKGLGSFGNIYLEVSGSNSLMNLILKTLAFRVLALRRARVPPSIMERISDFSVLKEEKIESEGIRTSNVEIDSILFMSLELYSLRQ